MLSQIKFGDRITVRQTIDPFSDDIQYIKSWEVALEPDGRLSMSKIGLGGKLGDNFVVRCDFNFGNIVQPIATTAHNPR